jgi:hypothetical protein
MFKLNVQLVALIVPRFSIAPLAVAAPLLDNDSHTCEPVRRQSDRQRSIMTVTQSGRKPPSCEQPNIAQHKGSVCTKGQRVLLLLLSVIELRADADCERAGPLAIVGIGLKPV